MVGKGSAIVQLTGTVLRNKSFGAFKSVAGDVSYHGEVTDGQPDGHGVFEVSNGAIWSGRWLSGKANGLFVIRAATGSSDSDTVYELRERGARLLQAVERQDGTSKYEDEPCDAPDDVSAADGAPGKYTEQKEKFEFLKKAALAVKVHPCPPCRPYANQTAVARQLASCSLQKVAEQVQAQAEVRTALATPSAASAAVCASLPPSTAQRTFARSPVQ